MSLTVEEQKLLAQLEACNTAAALGRLLESPACEEATFGEASLPRRGAEAIAAKAKTWRKPSEVAAAIMWLARLSAFAPNRVVRPRADVKDRVARVLEQQRDFLRDALASKDAGVRVAAGHALGCCRNADLEDLAVIEAWWKREKNNAALATALLCAGAVARRLGKVLGVEARAEVCRRALSYLGHADLVVRLASVASAALLEQQLPTQAVAVLSEAMRKPSTLPPGWGWFWQGRRDDTSHFAAELCGFVHIVDSRALVEALLAARARMPADETITNALMNTAFPQVSASGLALEELDEAQRAAIQSLAEHGSNVWEEKLGLWAWEGAKQFLQASRPAWRPLDVKTKSGLRRWHFVKISSAYAQGEVTLRHAVDAIVKGSNDPVDVIDAIIDAGMSSSEEEQRIVVALYERLDNDGLDVIAALDEARERSERNDNLMVAFGVLAACRSRGVAVPDEHDELFVEALDDARTASPLDELLETLPLARRERILLASVESLDDDWEWNGMHVAHVAFSERVARALVMRVHDVPEQRALAIATIARAGKAAVRLLTELDLNKSLSATRDTLVA